MAMQGLCDRVGLVMLETFLLLWIEEFRFSKLSCRSFGAVRRFECGIEFGYV